MRVTIRPCVYHGFPGFLVTQHGDRAWPQRVFTDTRELAEQLKAAWKRGARDEEISAIILRSHAK